jgi:hypothetical protein
MIGNYWNSAWRNLMKRKRFSFINYCCPLKLFEPKN